MRVEWCRVRWATIGLSLIASACAITPTPPRDQPCAFVEPSAIADALGLDSLAPREELDPTNENACRYLDPGSGDQVVMVSVVAEETTAEEARARTSLIVADHSPNVRAIRGPLGAAVEATTIERCRDWCATTVFVSLPPYYFAVHLTKDYGDADDARRITELVLDGGFQ